MFKKDIEKIYTDTIMEYVNNGYRINSSTMNGSQGEIAKVDLTNDKEVIRIYLSSSTDYSERRYWTECITLTVGRNTDKLTGQRHFDIIWNDNLEIISEKNFYKIGMNSNCYGTKEEAVEAIKKAYDRIKNKSIAKNNVILLPEKAKEIVLPFVRKQYKCKSIKINEIEKVEKIISDGKSSYYIKARGRNYMLS